MAELGRIRTRTTVKPIGAAPDAGLQASAQALGGVARDLEGVARMAAQEMADDRQLFERTTLAALENDALTEAARLSREFEGRPELIQPAYSAWAKERLKGAAGVLSENSRQQLPLWEQRLAGIGGRAVTEQYNVARVRQNADARSQFERLGETVRADMRLGIAQAAASGQPFDPRAMTERSAIVLRELGYTLAERGIITPTDLENVGPRLTKWATQEYVVQRAGRIAVQQGADAAQRYINDFYKTNDAFTPEEVRATQQLAEAAARDATAETAGARQIALTNFAAAVEMAETPEQLARIAVPGPLLPEERARAAAAIKVRMHKLNVVEADASDQDYYLAYLSAVGVAKTMGRMDMLPNDTQIDLMPEKYKVRALTARAEAEATILHQRDVASNRAAAAAGKALADAAEDGAVMAFEAKIKRGDFEGVPARGDLPDMVSRQKISSEAARRIESAYDKRDKENADIDLGSQVLNSGAGAFTSDHIRGVNAVANSLVEQGKMKVTDPTHLPMMVQIASSARFVPEAIARQFDTVGNHNPQEIAAMAAAAKELARYGLWKGNARGQAAWTRIQDALETNTLRPEELRKVAMESLVPSSPVDHAAKEIASAELSSRPEVMIGAVDKVLRGALDDATWLRRAARAIWDDSQPAYPTIRDSALASPTWSFGLGTAEVAVSPAVYHYARMAGETVAAASPVPLRPEQIARAGADGIVPRLGITRIGRPMPGTRNVLTIDAVESHYPESAGVLDETLSALAVTALRSMRANSLSARAMSFTVTDGGISGIATEKLSADDLAGDAGHLKMARLVGQGKVWVEPLPQRAADGRPQYAIMMQPDDDSIPERLIFMGKDGKVASSFNFSTPNVLMAREMFNRRPDADPTLRDILQLKRNDAPKSE